MSYTLDPELVPAMAAGRPSLAARPGPGRARGGAPYDPDASRRSQWRWGRVRRDSGLARRHQA